MIRMKKRNEETIRIKNDSNKLICECGVGKETLPSRYNLDENGTENIHYHPTKRR